MNICFSEHVLFPGLLEAACRKTQPLFYCLQSCISLPLRLVKSPSISIFVPSLLNTCILVGRLKEPNNLLHLEVADYCLDAEIELSLINYSGLKYLKCVYVKLPNTVSGFIDSENESVKLVFKPNRVSRVMNETCVGEY